MQGKDAWADRRVTRRRLLVMSVQVAGVGLVAGLLGACGQQAPAAAPKPTDAAKPAAPAATTAPAAAKPAEVAKPAAPAAAAPTQAAPASKPASAAGGTLKVGHFSNPSNLDGHRAVAGFESPRRPQIESVIIRQPQPINRAVGRNEQPFAIGQGRE